MDEAIMAQGFDPRTVQSVASPYTDWATRPTLIVYPLKIINGGLYPVSSIYLPISYVQIISPTVSITYDITGQEYCACIKWWHKNKFVRCSAKFSTILRCYVKRSLGPLWQKTKHRYNRILYYIFFNCNQNHYLYIISLTMGFWNRMS
jgi:hypothetical protein